MNLRISILIFTAFFSLSAIALPAGPPRQSLLQFCQKILTGLVPQKTVKEPLFTNLQEMASQIRALAPLPYEPRLSWHYDPAILDMGRLTQQIERAQNRVDEAIPPAPVEVYLAQPGKYQIRSGGHDLPRTFLAFKQEHGTLTEPVYSTHPLFRRTGVSNLFFLTALRDLRFTRLTASMVAMNGELFLKELLRGKPYANIRAWAGSLKSPADVMELRQALINAYFATPLGRTHAAGGFNRLRQIEVQAIGQFVDETSIDVTVEYGDRDDSITDAKISANYDTGAASLKLFSNGSLILAKDSDLQL